MVRNVCASQRVSHGRRNRICKVVSFVRNTSIGFICNTLGPHASDCFSRVVSLLCLVYFSQATMCVGLVVALGGVYRLRTHCVVAHDNYIGSWPCLSAVRANRRGSELVLSKLIAMCLTVCLCLCVCVSGWQFDNTQRRKVWPAPSGEDSSNFTSHLLFGSSTPLAAAKGLPIKISDSIL